MRVVFFGSPSEVLFPLLELRRLDAEGEIELVAIVSQPPRPFGRGHKLSDPPIADYAKCENLRVFQFTDINSEEALEVLASLNADVFITAAYGQILSKKFLKIAHRATINIHPSLLPKYRGATPVASALINGDDTTGVSILFTVRKLDAGAIIVQENYSIPENITCDVLTSELFKFSASLLPVALKKLTEPNFTGEIQNENEVSLCHKIQKSDGELDWSLPNYEIIRRFRAYTPWPSVYSYLHTQQVTFEEMQKCDFLDNPSSESKMQPGSFFFNKSSKSFFVACGSGFISLTKLKASGGKSLDAASFYNGLKNKNNLIFNMSST
ncbi:MAG: methionyl-tRNA formyltransferase [Oligoflexales bacterium]|nr:methionyl-tRNA formyltransferase [Oligoflexales bacterium]